MTGLAGETNGCESAMLQTARLMRAGWTKVMLCALAGPLLVLSNLHSPCSILWDGLLHHVYRGECARSNRNPSRILIRHCTCGHAPSDKTRLRLGARATAGSVGIDEWLDSSEALRPARRAKRPEPGCFRHGRRRWLYGVD